jgi:hypothetical protein
MNTGTQVRFGVGRLVGGSLYEGQTRDDKGVSLVFKSGKNAGQPRTSYWGHFAFPKNGTTDFKQTDWGKQLVAIAQAAFPAGQWQQPTFAFKVTDGDSTVPNAAGNIPNQKEGYPGHWVVKLSANFAPRVANALNGAPVYDATPNLIKAGDYVEVNAIVEGNGETMKPGLYVNFDAVCLRLQGAPIIFAPDVSSQGFGAAPLPTGANQAASQSAPLATGGNPPPPPSTTLRDAAGGNPPPPPVSGPQPTAKANGATKEAMLGWPGWDEAALLREGYLA